MFDSIFFCRVLIEHYQNGLIFGNIARHQQIALNESNKDKGISKGTITTTKKSYPSDIQFELDAYKRPQQKIALLCGTPGSGVCYTFHFEIEYVNIFFICQKTTLAHVVARHAGYNVIEMNARF